MRLLDPKIDIVFKVLLVQNPELLQSVIESVLDTPITDFEVLNPDLEKDLAGQKGVVLDVRVALANDTQIDLEMQGEVYPALRKRVLYYWARCCARELIRGDDHGQLRPVVIIVWLREKVFDAPRFHSTVRACEVHDHAVWSGDFELHLLELAKLHLAKPSMLQKWGRFFRFESIEDIEQLAREDPIMEKAKQALEKVSRDPRVMSLAEEKELAAVTWSIYMNGAREEGREEGRAQGEAIGEARGAIKTLCEVFGIELTADRRAQIEAMTIEELRETVARIKRERAW